MRRPIPVVAALLATALLAAGTARAITYGDPDGTAHPFVGLVALYHGGVYKGRCSGALITPTVVLTAAHCIVETGADQARIYLDPTVTDDPRRAPHAGSRENRLRTRRSRPSTPFLRRAMSPSSCSTTL